MKTIIYTLAFLSCLISTSCGRLKDSIGGDYCNFDKAGLTVKCVCDSGTRHPKYCYEGKL